jgi:nucleoside-diphosphate-sugar epimerase
VTAILRGQPPTVYGDGLHSRDFTYIENVIQGNVLAMNAPKLSGEVVNVACGGELTINEVIVAINRVLGTNIQPRYVDPRPGDIKHSRADIGLAKKVLGFQPTVGFEEGLRRAIEYYKRLV